MDEHLKFEKEKKGRNFGYVFTVVFIIISIYPIFLGKPVNILTFAVSAILFTLAKIYPISLSMFSVLWLKFGEILHKLTSPLILGIIFFFIITPIAIILKIMRKDILNLNYNNSIKSYWINRKPPGTKPESLINQF